MTQPYTTERLLLRARVRAGLLLLGGGLIVPLAVAAALEPSPRGFGTHEQLGLPPCTFLTVVGHPCPSCGMTTSWAHIVRGELWASLRANAAGTVLAALVAGGALWCLVTAIRGRYLWRRPSDTFLVVTVAVVTVITLVDWARRLMLG